MRHTLILLLSVMLISASRANAAEPIHFNGRIVTSDGRSLRGMHEVCFQLYADSSLRGIPLRRETHAVAADSQGYYAVALGVDAPNDLLKDRRLLYVSTETRDEKTLETVKAETVITSLPQGIWLNCNPDNSAGSCSSGATIDTGKAIATIGAHHFRYVLNASNFWGTQAQIDAYAHQAEASGVKIIWYLGSDFSLYLGSKSYSLIANDSELPATFCDGCSNSAFVASLVRYLGGLPATAGYLIDDEMIQAAANGYPIGKSGKQQARIDGKAIASLAHVIRAQDASHPIYGTEDYYNLPDASEAELSAYYSYIPNGALDFFGSDYYPLGALNSAPTDVQLTDDQRTAGNWLDSVATRKNANGTFEDLEAYNWSDPWEGGCPSSSCAFPTIAQLQDILKGATTASNAPSQLFWWEYADVVYNHQWNNLLTAINPQ